MRFGVNSSKKMVNRYFASDEQLVRIIATCDVSNLNLDDLKDNVEISSREFQAKLILKRRVQLWEMVHLVIDEMWQVFMLQRSTPRNDLCRVAAKNGILLRFINTLHSLNEATRLATSTGGGSIPADGSAPRPRSGPLDSSHPISIQCEVLLGSSGQTNLPKVKHRNINQSLPVGAVEPSWAPSSFSQRPDTSQHESSITSKLLELGTSFCHPNVCHLSGLERHETILPLLHSSAERKPNGELDFLMAKFAGSLYELISRFLNEVIIKARGSGLYNGKNHDNGKNMISKIVFDGLTPKVRDNEVGSYLWCKIFRELAVEPEARKSAVKEIALEEIVEEDERIAGNELIRCGAPGYLSCFMCDYV
ncbi:hypothetical protein GIB67_025085 [Kingdonia uniflora]|uniref:Uncharacterized protein n=1 Tax=Kingdonia uniflora TaxID=39325 RepID=A0A7J7N7L2_9MAGN|nr:hypothetical protein GIB67_025085 [Kingdonia uniflora]